MRNRVFVFIICIVLLVPVSALAAPDVPVRKEPIDLALVVSSFITFCFNQLFHILTFVEDGLVSMQQGSFDVPVFGSVYRAMKFAGMIDYTFPPGVGGNENLITDTICTVGLSVVGAIKKLLVYMEMHIQNGYFSGLLREFFAYLDQDLEQYAFYQVFRDFVTSLPGYRISEGLADFLGQYVRGRF